MPIYTILILKCNKMWDGFFDLATRSVRRRCGASLTETTLSQSGTPTDVVFYIENRMSHPGRDVKVNEEERIRRIRVELRLEKGF